MLRRLFTLVSLVSLVLCAATVVLWVRSYRVGYYSDSHGYQVVAGRATDEHYWFLSASGGLVYTRSNGWSDDPVAVGLNTANRGTRGRSFGTPEPDRFRTAALGGRRTVLGFHYGEDRAERAGDLKLTGVSRTIVVPYWSLCAGFAVVSPLPWLAGAAGRRRRRAANRCPACGYDLRATPGRCPECGVVPKGVAT
jgi:hypothetical protein